LYFLEFAAGEYKEGKRFFADISAPRPYFGIIRCLISEYWNSGFRIGEKNEMLGIKI
jgi:hypothetical protein